MLLQLPVRGRRGRAVPSAHPAGSSQRRAGGELLHVEGAVDLQLQGGGDRLHADDAAEAGQRVAEVGVHLAMLDELLLALQGHLTDATGSCVQTFTVGHLRKKEEEERETPST